MIKIVCVIEDRFLPQSKLRFEHGVSFWIETDKGVTLFDTGSTASSLAHNLSVLGLNKENIDAIGLSHAHYDHTGGLKAVLPSQKPIKIFANPDIFQPRYSLRDEDYVSIGFSAENEDLVKQAILCLGREPTKIMPGLWTSGEIVDRPEPMGSSTHHFIHTTNGFEQDHYLDDMSLVLETQKGLLLICGCCHAGLLNTLFHVEKAFKEPVFGIIGGTHLGPMNDTQLTHVIEVLNARYPDLIYFLNHCTGDRAIGKLAAAFGQRVKPFSAGSYLQFEH